ncbi:hypothetical protein A1OE_318 [Candidatus Endolissoclinum faulkneri L2]|uniref:Uncharacterized protein n=1 Tax=Candidatus Endolissoclinum faulkneri L2 TaxID=1193729 RepID=K7YFZ7_9PROT|nr:hypothetical protein A1OE_318 [Candidatus Endolissoclinum faulkneri L2]
MIIYSVKYQRSNCLYIQTQFIIKIIFMLFNISYLFDILGG